MITASHFFLLHCPSACKRRLCLHRAGAVAALPGPFEELLQELGERHERTHLATLPNVLDLSGDVNAVRLQRTEIALERHEQTLYQPLFRVQRVIDAREQILVGSPDFLIPDGNGWRIRDVKLNRDIDKPEILAQLNFYGLLLEHATGQAPTAIEVVRGGREIIPIEFEGTAAAERRVGELLAILEGSDDYEPVGWSKCKPCPYFETCWQEAIAANDVALLPDVDQGLARQLHADGCRTIAELAEKYQVEALTELRRPWGDGYQRVGAKAEGVLRQADCFLQGRSIMFSPPALPTSPNLVMFDLEGLPPHLEGIEKVFLWGFKIYGEAPSAFQYSCAFPGQYDDQAAWFAFLDRARSVFAMYGEIPFVHWAAYERSKLDLYIRRYGDPEGVAARVVHQLVDLLDVMRRSVCLPLPSRSLKEVEKYVGLQRRLPGKGDWAVSQYIRATELDDLPAAEAMLNDILQYNEEDLDATWAVYCWLRDDPRPAQMPIGPELVRNLPKP